MTTYVESDIIAETKKLVNQSIIYHIIIYMYYHICVSMSPLDNTQLSKVDIKPH